MFSSINRLILVEFLNELYFVGPIIVLFLLGQGLTLAQVLALSSIMVVATMLFEIPTGVFADRYGRKWSMVVGSVVTIFTWILWLYTHSFLGFIGLYILFGLSDAFYSGADEAMIYDELKQIGETHKAQRVFSVYYSAIGFGTAIASVIGGLLLHAQNTQAFYLLVYLYIAALTAGMLVLLTIRETRHSKEGDESLASAANMWTQFGAGWAHLKKSPKLLKLVLFSLFTTSFALMDLYQPYFTQAHVSPEWFGYGLAISSLLMAMVKLYAYKIEEWLGVEMGILLVSIIPAVLWLIMAMVFSPVFAVILFMLNDVVGNARDPILADYRNRHITGSHRATVLSTISLMDGGYVALMFLVVGVVANKSLSAAFALIACLILLGAVFFRIRASDVVVVE